jgi:hypothetical protein
MRLYGVIRLTSLTHAWSTRTAWWDDAATSSWIGPRLGRRRGGVVDTVTKRRGGDQSATDAAMLALIR